MITTERQMTDAELTELATTRFGPNYLDVAYRCLGCEEVAKVGDYPPGERHRAGRECIGRILRGRGCMSVAYGFATGPWRIYFAGGPSIRVFPLAPCPCCGHDCLPGDVECRCEFA